jgi:hypothetical protein
MQHTQLFPAVADALPAKQQLRNDKKNISIKQRTLMVKQILSLLCQRPSGLRSVDMSLVDVLVGWLDVLLQGTFRQLWDLLMFVFTAGLVFYIPVLIAFYDGRSECTYVSGFSTLHDSNHLTPVQRSSGVVFLTLTNMAFLVSWAPGCLAHLQLAETPRLSNPTAVYPVVLGGWVGRSIGTGGAC